MSGSPRDGNRSPDLKGNAPLPDAARVAVACVPTGATVLRCSTPSGGIFASSTTAVTALRQRRHHTVSDIFCVIP
ncbi:hypothetical protein IUJ34_22360 [Klebsiella pneumoniae subsp. pneumoniae]|uniref:Uncharacterized protein n=1 Tax=Klebsiella pneumoniae subsp. pneumoniae TaxID=72407 RepID=A0A7S9HFE7_KLEPN|nr:hypothetical protein IUJ34_22360 [Klebsiella pneumoniae subsp. pneumoniae]